MPVAKLFEEKRGLSTILLWTTMFMAIIVVYGLGTWLPKLMVEAGYPLKSSLLFLFALNIGVMIGNFTGGWLADRIAPKKVISVMLVIGAISLTLLGLKPGTVLLYLLVVLVGACLNGPGTTNHGYASKYYPITYKVNWGRLDYWYGSSWCNHRTSFWRVTTHFKRTDTFELC